MDKPNREPDFVCVTSSATGRHEFYMYPDMIWRHSVSPYNHAMSPLIEDDGELKCIVGSSAHKLWDEVQEKYKAYKKKLDLQIDGILLDD